MFSNPPCVTGNWVKSLLTSSLLTAIITAALPFALTSQPALAADDEIITHATKPAVINITLNQVTLVKLREKISDAIVGNPAIADITIQNNSTFVITGKSYGKTNIILLNEKGETIFNKSIFVDDDTKNMVRIQRGSTRLSYTCNPNCQPTPTLGDDPLHIQSVSGNLKSKLKDIGDAMSVSQQEN